MPANDDQRNRAVNLLNRAKKTIKRRFYLIPLTTAVLVGIFTAYIYLFPPVYKAELRILLEEQRKLDDPVEQFYYKLQTFRKSEDAATEAELILSDKVAERVAASVSLAGPGRHPDQRIRSNRPGRPALVQRQAAGSPACRRQCDG